MKHRLTRRLILCFSLVLLLFAILVGAMFTVLFSMHSAAIYAEDLEAHRRQLRRRRIPGLFSLHSGRRPV